MTRCVPFAKTYKGRDIFKYKPPESHIEHDITLTYALAARYWRLTPEQFREHETDQQAEMIAVMIVEQYTEAIVADERHKEMIRKSGQRGM